MQDLLESVTLYFTEGRSDKIYQAELVQVAGGWKVNFAFGRRGNALQPGTKTTTPQPYEVAHGIYAKLVAQKIAKGYTEGESGVRFQDTPQETRNTGIIPQLLNPIEDDCVETFLQDHRYLCQEKFDGKRILIRTFENDVQGINRTGLVVALPQALVNAAKNLIASEHFAFLIDGELLGDVFIVFDLLQLDNQDLRAQPYSDRLQALKSLSNLFNPQIVLAETASGADKRRFFNCLKEAGKEGCVFKDRLAAYTSGRPASGGTQRKYKFYETASFVVSACNTQRSVSLSLFDENGKVVSAGNVTIPANFSIPAVQQVIEARYLYAYRESGSVYQPVFLGTRDDIPRSACSTRQLKYKS
jgi:bifunctional non-homologous end joining protein LigD